MKTKNNKIEEKKQIEWDYYMFLYYQIYLNNHMVEKMYDDFKKLDKKHKQAMHPNSPLDFKILDKRYKKAGVRLNSLER